MAFSSAMLASRVRRFRYNKEMSIEQLAKKALVDKNTIVRIEKGEGRPNLKTLVNICNALEISVDRLIDMEAKENQDYFVYRKKKEKADSLEKAKEEGLRLGDLTAKLPFGHMNVVLLEIYKQGKMRSHPGEEFLLCLSGKVGVKIGNTEVVLDKGDSLMFFGREPHQYFNADKNTDSETAMGLSVWLDEDIDPQTNYLSSYHI